MSTNARVMDATPDDIWAVLADGWLFPVWVVGATRMREVDAQWPEVGGCLHHSVGAWPLTLDDMTEVLQSVPGSLLVLRARAWPAGEAQVTIRLRPQGARTEVVIEEEAAAGPASLVPQMLLDPPLKWRNVETLRRLAHIAERRPRAA
jgi:hypothetical protein